jgi:AdoMet-dependent rRNA methyltransferase SPB1
MPADSVVLGVDLLPIRPIRNVKTFVSDITTSECRALIKREIPHGWQADVVLCDGAPNVGAAYVKDAFVQNELALAALKTATDHLGKGGTFCTKVYRSQDYNALLWVFKQLFEEVQAVKPSSSRSQSAEIFVLCTQYKAPSSLDPRLLDPAHVFKQIEVDEVEKKPSIFDKAYGVAKRHRTGYDDSRGQGLRRSFGVGAFVECADPGQFLADADKISFDAKDEEEGADSEAEGDDEKEEKGLEFHSEELKQKKKEQGKANKKVAGLSGLYAEHSSTSEEVKACCRDLRVLNKGDFKLLLKWRLRLREFRAEVVKKAQGGGGSDDEGEVDDDEEGEDGIGGGGGGGGGDEDSNDEETEEGIMSALEARQQEARQKARREKKKQREAAAKLRVRKALGMAHNSFEAPVDESVFSLNAIKGGKKQRDEASKVSKAVAAAAAKQSKTTQNKAKKAI